MKRKREMVAKNKVKSQVEWNSLGGKGSVQKRERNMKIEGEKGILVSSIHLQNRNKLQVLKSINGCISFLFMCALRVRPQLLGHARFMAIYIYISMPVSQYLLTFIGWIAMTFCTDVHDSHTANPNCIVNNLNFL